MISDTPPPRKKIATDLYTNGISFLRNGLRIGTAEISWSMTLYCCWTAWKVTEESLKREDYSNAIS